MNHIFLYFNSMIYFILYRWPNRLQKREDCRENAARWMGNVLPAWQSLWPGSLSNEPVHTNFPRKQPWSSRAASWGTQNLAKS